MMYWVRKMCWPKLNIHRLLLILAVAVVALSAVSAQGRVIGRISRVGFPSAGGYLVPDAFESVVIDLREEFGVDAGPRDFYGDAVRAERVPAIGAHGGGEGR